MSRPRRATMAPLLAAVAAGSAMHATATGPPPAARLQQEPPSFARLPEYDLADVHDTVRAAFDFYDGARCTTVVGKTYHRTYMRRDDAPTASDSFVVRHYVRALENLGGTVLFDGECREIDCNDRCDVRMLVGKVVRAGQELWVEVVPRNAGAEYGLTLLTRQVLPQAASADSGTKRP